MEDLNGKPNTLVQCAPLTEGVGFDKRRTGEGPGGVTRHCATKWEPHRIGRLICWSAYYLLGGLTEWGSSLARAVRILFHGETQFLGTRMTRYVDRPDPRSTR